jgi:hypothetical protein
MLTTNLQGHAMRLPRLKLTVRRMMCVVATVGVALGIADAVRISIRSPEYCGKTDSAERMERRCREIDAMDAATRASEADPAFDSPYLNNPAWNRKMISYFEGLKRKHRYAAEHPRIPIPPDPTNP